MKQQVVLDRLLEEGNGYLQTADALRNGVSKQTLARYVLSHGMERVRHGVYAVEDAWQDAYYLLYLRNRRIVFSHESALYLHGMTDREPAITTVTVPEGYNSSHIAKQHVKVIHVTSKWYDLGITMVRTGVEHKVPVYDRERTLCDIIRNKEKTEIQIFQTAVREYMDGKEKNLRNLMRYAMELGIEDKVRTYTEVML